MRAPLWTDGGRRRSRERDLRLLLRRQFGSEIERGDLEAATSPRGICSLGPRPGRRRTGRRPARRRGSRIAGLLQPLQYINEVFRGKVGLENTEVAADELELTLSRPNAV
jgi:hypothetical protein